MNPQSRRLTHRLVIGALAYVTAFVLNHSSLAADSTPGCFSAASAFSTNSNPNGVWRYGYSTTLGGTLVTMLERGSIDGLIFWRSNLWLGAPNVVFNPSSNTVTSTTVTFAPRQLAFHPGPGGEFSVIRFTSPSNAVYRISGSFAGVDTHGTTTDVHIMKNGAAFFNGLVNGFGPGSGPSFDTNMNLAVGDRLEFAVGWGANSEFSFDTTGIDANICAGTNSTPPPTTNCVAVPSGLVSWWRGEGNALDSADGNHGVAMNGISYSPAARVGQGFQLDGVNDYISISNQPNLNPTGSFTIEGWIYPNADHTGIILAKWGDQGEYANQRSYSFQIVPGRGLEFAIADAAHQLDQPFHQFIVLGVVNPTNWNHVACVYDQAAGKRTLYVNGALVGERTDSPITVLNSITKVAIGAWTRSPSATLDHFNGRIDELGFYNRVLTGAEVLAIYAAGSAGKCISATPPSITTHPVSQSVTAGDNVTFSVAATGTSPLSYQWRLNQTNIAGATSTTLTLTGVQLSQAGVYSVRVTNIAGMVFSSNAVLTVIPPPACTAVPTGAVSWWRGEGNALDSADGNHGVAMNGVSYSSARVGQGFQLDGVNDYISISNQPNLNPAGSFSIEGWIYPNADHTGVILAKWGDQGEYANQRSYTFQIVPGRGLQLGIADAAHQLDQPFHQFIVLGVINPTNWNHVACVYDQAAGKRTLYVNGALVGERTDSPITVLNSTAKVAIGAWMRSPTTTLDHFNGRIDELGFYNRVLTGAEVLAIYAAGSAGKCPPPPPCGMAPSGLAAWWPGNSNTMDVVGGNHGTLLNGAGYAPGQNDLAFNFTALDHSVRIPNAPALNPTNGLTLEGWVYVSQYPANDGVVIAGKDAVNDQRQYLIALNWTGNRWSFRPHVTVPSGMKYFDGNTAIQTGTWYHVAMTHDNSTLRLYVNGVFDGSMPAQGIATPTSNPMNIGGFGTAPWTLTGKVDELGLYSRALTTNELQGIFAAGSSGKCQTPPFILTHPLNQKVTVGSNVTFSVVADGVPQLRYQWRRGTTNLSGATSTSHTFVVTPNSGGQYSVRVTNWFGSVFSSNALLTVNFIPVANPQSVTVNEDSFLNLALTGSDTNGDALAYSIVTPPAHGSLTGTNANRTYTPAPNYFGPDSFTFKVNDGLVDSAPATVSINVINVNDPPVAQSQSVATDEDTPLVITLGASDLDGDPLTYGLTAPAHGSLSGTPPNVTYTPNTNFFGPDSFTFSVSDGKTNSNTATVSITVRSVNDAPIARIEVSPLTQVLGITNKVVVAAVCGDATVVLDGNSSSDVENDPLTYEWTEGTNSLGSTAIATNPFAIGTHEVTLTVNDGNLDGTAREIVEVVSPAQGLGIMIAYIEETDLGRRNGRPLVASLKAAAASFDDCRTIPGVNQLEAFQNKVRAQIAPLDAELAAKLIAAAQQIIDAVQANQ